MFDEFIKNIYGYEKNEDGLIKFPDDRRTHRISKLVKPILHPAKNNLYMLEALCRYTQVQWAMQVGRAEDAKFWILDPMAGAGSIIAGAEYCDRMFLIELGKVFSDEIEKNIAKLELANVMLLPETDCVEGMNRMRADSIGSTIFSPPYANQLQMGKGTKVYDDKDNTAGKGTVNYTYDHRRNMSNMKNFQFNRVMRDFYKEIFRVTQPNGMVTCIIKDRMKAGERIHFGNQQVQWAGQAGFRVKEWHGRVAIGSIFGHYNLQQGIAQVTDEHIIILRKPVA